MNGARAERWVTIVSLVSALAVAPASPALAQLLTSPSTHFGPFNEPDVMDDGIYKRFFRSKTSIVSAGSDTFTADYRWGAAADAGAFVGWVDTWFLQIPLRIDPMRKSDWSMNFGVQAPVGYEAKVDFTLSGAMTTIDEGAGDARCFLRPWSEVPFASHSADAPVVVVNSLALVLFQLSSENTTGVQYDPFNLNLPNRMTVRGVSNGQAVHHWLRFRWYSGCSSDSPWLGWANGDEAALRAGLPEAEWSVGESASDYPGVGGRNRLTDGMFVTVRVRSLCGDGTLDGDAGEQCDLGSDNGKPDRCCTATCQFKPAGTSCRNAAGPCDRAESCSGSAEDCPPNGVLPAGSTCRAAAGPCDVPETCNGSTSACPPNAFRPSGTMCRPAANSCDTPEQCAGGTPFCPPDAKLPDGDGDGTCDAIDNCVTVPNPDQRDCDNAGGGDLCDPCPSTEPNTLPTCDPARSGADTIGAAGGTLTKGRITLRVPANAVSRPTSFSITTRPSGSRYGIGYTGGNLVSVADLCPEGATFNPPVIVEYTWVDGPPPDDIIDDAPLAEALTKMWRTDTGTGVPVALTNQCQNQPCAASCVNNSGFSPTADCCCAPTQSTWNKWLLVRSQFSEMALGHDCPPVATGARLEVTNLDTPPGDDTLRFEGTFTLPSGIPRTELDPLAHGIRLILDAPGRPLLDVLVPAGHYAQRAGWSVDASGTRWVYRNRTRQPPGGIVRAAIEDRGASRPGLVAFVFEGVRGSYAATKVVGRSLELPARGQCFRFDFEDGRSCRLDAVGRTLACEERSTAAPTVTTTTTPHPPPPGPIPHPPGTPAPPLAPGPIPH
ncbi:MAG TPA: hypothetical protein VKA21_14640 [Candidatus Binatia bacterium]|nr:hypothetical protein [Candidatus Binatia bacterium]